MAVWAWDPRVHRYRDLETGRFLRRLEVLGYVENAITAADVAADQLASFVADGMISPRDFETLFREELKMTYIQEYLLGIGGRDRMTQADWGSIGGMLAEQYRYLEGFVQEIAEGRLSEAQIQARVRMYTNSAREAYERAHGRVAAAAGVTEELWVVDPEAESCQDCLDFGAMGWQPAGTFPIPGDGSTECLCILSPESLVLTRLGWQPMWHVAVGQEVLTHRGRWRRVIGVHLKGATGKERAALVSGPLGDVWCTDTHLWHTDAGWRSAKEAANVEGFSLPLWECEGLPSVRMPILRVDEKSVGAVGGQRIASDYSGRYPPVAKEAPDTIRGPVMGHGLATQDGWTLLDLVLGRRPQADDLSLPVGMVGGAWQFAQGQGCASPERRRGGRPLGESQDHVFEGTPSRACESGRMGSGQSGTEAGMGVPVVWAGLQAFVAQTSRRVSRAEILLAGLLSRGTALYDLIVDEDHSFVIAGFAAHNTNCKCGKLYRNPDTGVIL